MGFKGMDVFEREFSTGISNRITKNLYDVVQNVSREIVNDCQRHCRVDTGAMKESFQAQLMPDVMADDKDIMIYTTMGSVADYEAHGKKPKEYVLLWEYGFETVYKRHKKGRGAKGYENGGIQMVNGDFMFTNAITRGKRILEKYIKNAFLVAISGK